jgi:hypothetical protein
VVVEESGGRPDFRVVSGAGVGYGRCWLAVYRGSAV